MPNLTLISRALGLLICSAAAHAEPSPADRPLLSPIFGNHMVLQRDKPNAFWGWAPPGTPVHVTLNTTTVTALAAADGGWSAQVTPPPVGTACTLRIEGPRTIELRDLLVGDVWLCGGQSNMEWPLAAVRAGAAEVAAADHPRLRLFKVKPRSAYGSTDTVEGTWRVCTPDAMTADGGFSAVAYYFGRRLQAATGVPVGLIQSALGGSPAESWMAPTTLGALPDQAAALAEIDRLHAAGVKPTGSFLLHWLETHDAGAAGAGWAAPAFDPAAWPTVTLPAAGFAPLGLEAVPAVVWFRREVELPDPLPPGDPILHLGSVEKMDTAWVNGVWVGASSWVEQPRAYRVPAAALRPGRNGLAVRVFKWRSRTGFLDGAERLALTWPTGPSLPLAGPWRAAVGVDARPPHPLPLGWENYPTMPTVLYRGMIAPLAPLALTGVVWYQGEANASRAHAYRTLLPALIGDWRAAFAQGDFPFLIAGLPRFQARRAEPGSDDWAELREAQALTARRVPGAALAVLIDTGEAENIHPPDKAPVGERLAALALGRHYGRSGVVSGPTFREMRREGAAVRLWFDHAADGLEARDGPPGEFSLAGADRVWHWADDARIEGETVLVSAAAVPVPVAVRYAWQSNPRAALFNAAGWPATPFRTDDWPGVTAPPTAP